MTEGKADHWVDGQHSLAVTFPQTWWKKNVIISYKRPGNVVKNMTNTRLDLEMVEMFKKKFPLVTSAKQNKIKKIINGISIASGNVVNIYFLPFHPHKSKTNRA